MKTNVVHPSSRPKTTTVFVAGDNQAASLAANRQHTPPAKTGAAQWSQTLQSLADSTADANQLLTAIAAAYRQRPGVVGSLVAWRGDDGNCQRGKMDFDSSLGKPTEDARQALAQSTQITLDSPSVTVQRPEGQDRFLIVGIPFSVNRPAAIALLVDGSLVVRIDDEISLAQITIAQVATWLARQRAAQLDEQLRTTAAILELVGRLHQSKSVDEACLVVANELKDHLKCDSVFIGLNGRSHTCQVKAISGLAHFDRQAESTLAQKAVLDEAMVRDSLGAWPPIPGTNSHQLLAHKQLARRDRSVLSITLRQPGDEPAIGALGLVASREFVTNPQIRHLLQAICEPLSIALRARELADGGRSMRWLRRAFSRENTSRRRFFCLAAIAMTALMFVPVRYRIAAPCLSEPVARRFCVAPHDGLLQTTFVRPGDRVSAGQTLAQLDGRQIRWELASVTAELQRVLKEKDAALANHQTAQALQAELQAKRLQSEVQLLQFRESNLLITSPVEGVVLAGSLDSRENYPASKGEVLYEIAPLNELRIEAAVDANQIRHVREGMNISVRLSGSYGKKLTGIVDRIRPRSEIRDERNVFIAEVRIANVDQWVRPGMKGYAKIEADHKTIGWIALHRAWEAVRNWLPG